MPNILPVSDLRNYNEVLKNCQVGEPVFLTKNGRGRFVVMDIEDYERDKAEKKLLEKLQEAEAAVKAAIALGSGGTTQGMEGLSDDGLYVWVPFEKVDSSNVADYQ